MNEATVIGLLTIICRPCLGADAYTEAPIYTTFGDGGRIALSADGRWLAYVVGDALWITNTGSDETRQVSKKGQIAAAPRWSPDAKHLAYYIETDGAKQLNVWNRETSQVRVFSEARAFTIIDGSLRCQIGHRLKCGDKLRAAVWVPL
jgi:hypothetical protein